MGIQWHDFGARNYDAALGRWMNLDPLADDMEQINTSPYSAFWNDPIKYNDPTGMKPEDDYGLDTKTGELIFLRETKGNTDTIYTGEITNMNDDGSQNFKKDGGGKTFKKGSSNIKEVTTAKDSEGNVVGSGSAHFQGLVFNEGNLEIGLEVMEFISFKSNIELSAWGFENSKGQGLFISHWSDNDAFSALDDISKFSDNVTKVNSSKSYGKKIGKVHTHPGSKDGRGGFGIPSGAPGLNEGDLYNRKQAKNKKYPHYINSKHEGWTDY